MEKKHVVSVNYDKSLIEMAEEIFAVGHYAERDTFIESKGFQSKRSGLTEVEVELIGFDYAVSTPEVLQMMERIGARAAEPQELLALCAKLQDDMPGFTVALGTLIRVEDYDEWCAVAVWNREGDRSIRGGSGVVHSWEGGTLMWNPGRDIWFAIVRK